MKGSSILPTSLLLFLLTINHNVGISQKLTYNMDDVEKPYVLVQLKVQDIKQDSFEAAQAIKAVVDQVKAINAKLGYELFDKKIASFHLDANGKRTPYLAIRNFENFTSAEAYSYDIWKELPAEVYGLIKEPFPISAGNYKTCIEGKDFGGYYKLYSSTRK